MFWKRENTWSMERQVRLSKRNICKDRRCTRAVAHKYLSSQLTERVDLRSVCFPATDRRRWRNYFSNKIYDRRRVIVAKCTAIRYCANNRAKLFNNRPVSQRFILAPRSPELRGDKFDVPLAPRNANNIRLKQKLVCLPCLDRKELP